jgi:hypothetical protein
MGLRKHAIEWREEYDAPTLQAMSPVPSPALELQAMLQQHHAALTAPGLDRETMRRLLTTLAAAGCALWVTLVVSANCAVSLVA